MAFNQGAPHKYGTRAHFAPSTSLTLVTGEVSPKHRTLQVYTPAPIRLPRMSENYGNHNSQQGSDNSRQYMLWDQQKERFDAFGYIVGGIARNPEHAAWIQQQEDLRNQRPEPTYNPPNTRGGSIQYNAAQILDQSVNQLRRVMVIQDSACEINFISPKVAEKCNLTSFFTDPIRNQTLTGEFISDRRTKVHWFGSSGNSGHDWFYIAPEIAPIDVLVGTQFMNDHPNVFDAWTKIEPAFLNVQRPVEEGEEAQIEADEADARRRAADLAKKKKKNTKHREPRHKEKPASSSSNSGSSRRRKE